MTDTPSRIRRLWPRRQQPLEHTRQEAKRQIGSSQRIFIAYSHTDLRTARRLRRRFYALRPGGRDETVFLDQDSLSPGSAVSPAVIDVKIRECDLFVLLCGERTAQSIEVRREMNLALSRIERPPAILPIILRAGLTLPEGVDYRIHGIFLETLFPSIFWGRIAVTGAIALLLGTTGVFVWRSMLADRAHQREVVLREQDALRARGDRLRASLALDVSGPQVPTDLPRRERLETLAGEAGELRLPSEENTLRQQLARLASPEARLWISSPAPQRLELSGAAGSSRLLVGNPRQLEVIEAGTGSLLRAVDLDAITAELPANRTPLWQRVLRDIGHTSLSAPRAPATLIRVDRDGARDRTVGVEVAYEHFGLRAAAQRVERHSGRTWFEGDSFYAEGPREKSEHEWLLLDLEEGTFRSAGLLRQIKWAVESNLAGEENGREFYEATDGKPEYEPSWIMDGVYAHEGKQSLQGTKVLAVDPTARQALVEVRRHDRWVEKGYNNVTRWTDIHVLLVRAQGNVSLITPITNYLPDARHRYSQDGRRQIFTDVVPEYAPAALWGAGGHACLRDKCGPVVGLQSGLVDLPWNTVASIRFTADGRGLIVQFTDESVGLYELATRALVSRFLPPPGTRRIVVDNQGTQVTVLLKTGALEAWRLDAFGPDGWATRR